MKDKVLALKIFETWLKDKHPYFYIIFGLFILLFGIGVFASLVLIFFTVWWWKLLIFSSGMIILIKFVMKILLKNYVDEFTESMTKK